MDIEQAQEIWKSLRSAVSEIYNKNASVLSFEELYRSSEFSECLYSKRVLVLPDESILALSEASVLMTIGLIMCTSTCTIAPSKRHSE